MVTIKKSPVSKERLKGIDGMRFIAIVGVIFLHCFPAEGTQKMVIDQGARFAVPFFFIASGYFLTTKLMKQESSGVYLKYAKKILILYVAWTLIYFLDPPFNAQIFSIYADRFYAFTSQSWEQIFFEGISGHFWFFISLILTVLAFMAFRIQNIQYFLVLSIILYCVGVMGKAYSNTPIGLSLPINTRNFIFFSSFPFALGAYIRKNQIQTSLKTAIMITVSGFVLHFTEAWILRNFYTTDIQDYGFSTFLMGLGAFLLAMHEFSILKSETLFNLGKLTLGIYASHILIAKRLHILYIEPLVSVWFIVWPILVLLFSILLTQIFLRTRYLSSIV